MTAGSTVGRELMVERHALMADPVFLGDTRLFAMVHHVAIPKATGVVILNSGLLHNVGPFCLHVALAAKLAERGFTAMRLDQSGKGESPSRPGMSRELSLLADYDSAMGYLRERGVERAVIVGLCSGADDGLHIAQHRDSVYGLVMLDGYAPYTFRHYIERYRGKILRYEAWRRKLGRIFSSPARGEGSVSRAPDMVDIRDWKSPKEMLAQVRGFLSGGGKILAVFSGGADYYNYHPQLQSALNFPAGLTEIHIPTATHIYSTCAERTLLLRHVVDWVNGECE